MQGKVLKSESVDSSHNSCSVGIQYLEKESSSYQCDRDGQTGDHYWVHLNNIHPHHNLPPIVSADIWQQKEVQCMGIEKVESKPV